MHEQAFAHAYEKALWLEENIMIITVFSGTNHVENSMIAIHLAALRARDHHEALLIDADPPKHSFLWCLRRSTSNATRFHVPVLPVVDASLHAELKQLHSRCKDIVIDAGGLDETDMQTALVASRAIVVPTCMASADVPAVVTTLKQAASFHPEARVIIVAVQGCDDDTSASASIANKLLAELPSAKLAHVAIQDRGSVAAAFWQGLTVFETTPVDELATAEIEGLAAEVYGGTEDAPGMEEEIRAAMATVERWRDGAKHRSRT